MSRPEIERCPRPPQRLRWWRWVLWALAVSCGLVLVLAGGSVWLAHSLSRPWIKQRIAALVLEIARVEIDYGTANVSVLSGLEVDRIVVRSPAEVRAVSSELLRIERLRVGWSLRALVGGRQPAIREVGAQAISLSVVINEAGRTTFDAISSSTSPSPSTPLSQLPREVLAVGSYLQILKLDSVQLSLLRTSRGQVVERNSVRGLGLTVQGTAQSSSQQLELALGKPDQPQLLVLERHRDGGAPNRAEVHLAMGLGIGHDGAKLALDLRVLEQNFVPDYKLERLLHVDAEARFNERTGQTTVRLKRADLADGAASVEAQLMLPDRGPPVLESARVDADLVRVLHRLPGDLVPARLRRGELHGHINNFALGHPTASASFALEGTGEDVELTSPEGSVGLRSAAVSLKGQPRDTGFEVQGTALLDGLSLAFGGVKVQGSNWALTLEGQQAASGAYTGQTELKFASLDLANAPSIAMRNGRIALGARDAQLDSASPLASNGDITVEASAESIDGHAQGHFTAATPKIACHLHHAPAEPWSGASVFETGRLRLIAVGGRELVNSPIRAELRLKDLLPDLERPLNSQGIGLFKLEAGALKATVDTTKRIGQVDFVLDANAPRLGELHPFLPADFLRREVLDRATFEIHSKGRLALPAEREPSIDHQTVLRVSGLEYGEVVARAATLELKSSGTTMQHQLEADLRAEGVGLGRSAAKDEHVALKATLDRLTPALALAIEESGLLKATLRAKLGFDRDHRAITHDIASQASGLSAIAPLLGSAKALAALDWSKCQFDLRSQGSLTGIVSDVDERGAFQFTAEPLRTWGGQSAMELRLSHLDWDDGHRAARVPQAMMRVGLHGDGERHTMVSDLEIDAMDLGFESNWIKLSKAQHHASATLVGRYETGPVELTQTLSIAKAEQNFAPMYPVGDVSLSSTVHRDDHGVLRINSLEVDNRAAGTSISVSGGLELFGDLSRFALRTELRQDLARLSTEGDEFVGRGKARVDLAVESPDLRVLHTEAQLHLDDAHVRLPRKGVVLDAINGEVPIELDIVLDRHGIELMHGGAVNPYMTHRFADQHPLLSHRSFLSIGSLKTPFFSIAPFAANLEMRQKSLALSQLEMGLRGGAVTGNGVLEWDGANSKLHADLRASGVQSSYGEPFDGNTSLVVDLADHSIEGRADIVRIGPRHLVDLLDLLDPYRADPAINRIRGALAYGYPKRVNIAFRHGFASASVNFGGLAQLISVEELRGVPIGPLLDRVVRTIKLEEKP